MWRENAPPGHGVGTLRRRPLHERLGLCTNGSDCVWLFDGEICPPNDACGFGGCAPDGCTGGTCLATLCFAPCQGPGNCPYEGMACSTNRGHICVWPHE